MRADPAIPIERFAAAGLRMLAVMILVGGILASVIYWVVDRSSNTGCRSRSR